MFCKQCGTENKEKAKFCEKCGTPLNSEDAALDISDEKSRGDAGQGNSLGEQAAASFASVSEHSRKKKVRIGAVIILAAAVICIVGLMVYHNQQQAADYRGKLQTAGKYIEEMDYSKAEASYLEAIKIQPKKEDAYLKLADTYVAQKKYDKAIKVLNTGKKKTSSKKIEKKIKSVQKEKKAKASGMSDQQYTAYYDLCKDYMDKYGEPGYEAAEYTDALYDMTGLCIIKLFDFDYDGNQELILGYHTGKEDDNIAHYEIWTWEKGSVKKILEDTPMNSSSEHAWIETTVDDKNCYLVTTTYNFPQGEEYADIISYYNTSYLQLINGVFKEKYIWESYTLENGKDVQKINGTEISSFEEAEKQVPARVQEENTYSQLTSYEPNDNSFCIQTVLLTESYAEGLLAETNNTLEVLKGNSAEKEKETGEDAKVLRDTAEFNGHYYIVFTMDGSPEGSWEKAQKYCENHGGNLAVITSKKRESVRL